MKKTTFTLLLLVFSCCRLAAQCPTADITFSTQGQVDSFQLIYPRCTGLPGNVKISGAGISNLQGLSTLDSIIGFLSIAGNPVLASLNGLESLTYVGSGLTSSIPGKGNLLGLSIQNNTLLTSLGGLDRLKSIGACLTIEENPALVIMNSLDSLSEVGLCFTAGGEWSFPSHSIGIIENKSLKTIGSLNGLDSLEILTISGNDSLVSLNGLKNLQWLGGELRIGSNNALTSLSGLEKLRFIEGGLGIDNNDALTYLTELENLQTIGYLGISENDALISLSGLEKIDSIGSVSIYSNKALSSLSALENLRFVGGALSIDDNDALTGLTGLENIQSVGGELSISNNKVLTSLTGLNHINSIGAGLIISGNKALQSLNGLEKLKSLTAAPGFKSNLEISSNPNLKNLTGLDSLNFATIGKLKINGNHKLSVCNIQPVCAYLQTTGAADVFDNAPGCNTTAQIKTACQASPVEDLFAEKNAVRVFPNPVDDVLQIQMNDYDQCIVSLYDLQGRLLLHCMLAAGQELDVERFAPGMYTLRATADGHAYAGRFIKQ